MKIGWINMKSYGKIESLDGARFFAIIIIVFSHFEFLSKYTFGNFYNYYIHNPTMGVDFFFVLSGFGMMYSYIKKNKNNKCQGAEFVNSFSYAWKHVKKIYLYYVVSLLVCLPLCLYDSIVVIGKSFFPSLMNTLIKLFSCLLLVQSASGISSISHGINGVGWFLSCLFCIYLISPFLIRKLNKVVKNRNIAIVLLCLDILLIAISAQVLLLIEQHSFFDDLVYSSPYRRVFYVILGMLLALIYSDNITKKNVKIWSVVELVSVILSVIWFVARGKMSIYFGTFVYCIDALLCALLLYSLAMSCGCVSRILSYKVFIFLGEISMYIFLFHYPIRMYAEFFVSYMKIASDFVGIIEAIFILSSSIILAIAIKHYNDLKVDNLK